MNLQLQAEAMVSELTRDFYFMKSMAGLIRRHSRHLNDRGIAVKPYVEAIYTRA